MLFFRKLGLFFFCLICISGCQPQQLKEVSVQDFAQFVAATQYITDAEKYGWSIVQDDIFNYRTVDSIDWRNPTGLAASQPNFPVTQVSYNDAQAYADWADTEIPSYEQYWKWVANDDRAYNISTTQIFELGVSNIVGNVWEITQPDAAGQIRLAGGSYLCDEKTCSGFSPDRVLYVDRTTGNSHIGMVVMVK